jgi:hypothetical protein
LWVAAGLVVLLGGGAAVALGLSRSSEHDAARSSTDRAAAMTGAVSGYLQAVADADAAGALAFLYVVPDSKALLTDDVLAASATAAPISGIAVSVLSTGDDGYTAQVDATYQAGDQEIEHVYEVNDWDDDGEWQVVDGTFDLDLGDRVKGLGATINGQPVVSGTVSVFPGTYTLVVASGYYSLEGPATIEVHDAESATLADVAPVLTQAGADAFVQTVRDAAAACLGSTTLVAGCGLDLPGTLSDGSVLDDGTLARTPAPETQAALDSLQPAVDPANPSLVTAGDLGQVDVTADCTIGEAKGRCQVSGAPGLPKASVLMTEPELQVTWG